jgi:uncharacterized membrane protein
MVFSSTKFQNLKTKVMDAVGMLSLLQKAVMVAPAKKNIGTTGRIFSSAAGLILGYTGIKNFRKGGFALLIPAGYLLWRGAVKGYCPPGAESIDNAEEIEPFEFVKTLTIKHDRSEIYDFWRKLENLPHIMKHIQKVIKISDNLYYWEVEFNNQQYKWNAEITEDIPHKKISWRSVEKGDVQNSGSVEFIDAHEKKGTEMKVTMMYQPAKTKVGRMIGSVLDPVFKQMVKDDLRRFKHLMETGEVTVDKT